MRILGALDVHRKQITFKLVDTDTGEVGRGRIFLRVSVGCAKA
jgi:hypothetical protein